MNFTLGIEEEFQTIDPQTRELKSHMSQIVEGGRVILQERIRQEMHQSVVETGTNICQNICQAREEVTYLRRMLIDLAEKQNLKVAAAGTHPISDWQYQLITPGDRYEKIIEEMRDVARANLIFGLHVHIGIQERSEAITIMNEARHFLPHIFALSTNSPFWCGRNTGFKSYRAKIFDKFPRTGIPEHFNNVTDYDNFVNLLIKTGSIDNGKKIWWDLRLHPFYPTIEFRICDVPMRLDETICLAAIIQALVAKLHKLQKKNLSYHTYPRVLVSENKWRAARYGIDSKMINFEKEIEVDFNVVIFELLNFIEDTSRELNSIHEITYAEKILVQGTGADRQLKVFKNTKSLESVVDYIISETKYGIE